LLADRSRTCCAASARACRRSCCPTYRRSGPPRLNRGQASLFGEVTPCVPPEPAAGQPGNTRSGSRSSRGSRRWRPVGRRSPTTPRPSACAGAAQHARADRVPAGPTVQHSAANSARWPARPRRPCRWSREVGADIFTGLFIAKWRDRRRGQPGHDRHPVRRSLRPAARIAVDRVGRFSRPARPGNRGGLRAPVRRTRLGGRHFREPGGAQRRRALAEPDPDHAPRLPTGWTSLISCAGGQWN
jgi:hypothetical protein